MNPDVLVDKSTYIPNKTLRYQVKPLELCCTLVADRNPVLIELMSYLSTISFPPSGFISIFAFRGVYIFTLYIQGYGGRDGFDYGGGGVALQFI